MTLGSPERAEEYNTILSPVSPKPLHYPIPSNIPVLEKQTDPVFNQTATHMAEVSAQQPQYQADAPTPQLGFPTSNDTAVDTGYSAAYQGSAQGAQQSGGHGVAQAQTEQGQTHSVLTQTHETTNVASSTTEASNDTAAPQASTTSLPQPAQTANDSAFSTSNASALPHDSSQPNLTQPQSNAVTASGAPGAQDAPGVNYQTLLDSLSQPATAKLTQPEAGQILSPSAQAFREMQRLESERERRLAAGEQLDDENAPWTSEIQKKYDHFLDEERKYVTDGNWEQFPQGSRLFVGNLSSERVTKRDIFHIFHKRAPDKVPEVQIIVLDGLDRGFIEWVERAYTAKGVRVDVLLLSPRLSEQAVIRRQILEGVLAVSRLSRTSQQTGKISLQVFDRRGGADNVRFEEYDNLDPPIAAELVLRARSMHAGPSATPTYGYGYNPAPPPAPAAPQSNLSNLITNLDPSGLQKLLGAMQSPAPLRQPHQPPQAPATAITPDLAKLLGQMPSGFAAAAAAPAQSSPQQQQFPASTQAFLNSAGIAAAAVGGGAAAPWAAQQQMPLQLQPQQQRQPSHASTPGAAGGAPPIQAQGQPDMAEILARLNQYRR
ncbi:nuclear polyadenylated RNA-binding protein 3 [Taxawa tesnikishii (nom. ined.)]|nr:nuclear polyadenylated RNA-binding protein 3 [Dothideales sp. JES 119]